MKTTKQTVFTKFESAIGELLLVGSFESLGLALNGVYFTGKPHAGHAALDDAHENRAAFKDVVNQLREYFTGKRTSFDVLLAASGTEFQREVWQALAEIPYGETTTYAAIARTIGRPKAVRAVGAANGRNPLSIIVPCHRVIGGDGTLTGYAGGIEQKKTLLALEARAHPQ